MGKKCIICNEEAKYSIKNSSECYCEECAKEHFNDVSVLISVEEQAKKIKKLIEEKSEESIEDTEELVEESTMNS